MQGFVNRPIERYHNEVRAVLKCKRGLGNDNSAQQFAHAHRIYHNLCRPHTGLPNNIQPAQAAGIDLNLGQNKIKDLIEKSAEAKEETKGEYDIQVHLVKTAGQIPLASTISTINYLLPLTGSTPIGFAVGFMNG